MADFGPLSDEVMPIQIRKELFVYIQGIPLDLTQTEAAKIAAIVIACAAKPTVPADYTDADFIHNRAGFDSDRAAARDMGISHSSYSRRMRKAKGTPTP